MNAASSAFATPSPFTRRAWRSLLRLKLSLLDRRKYEHVVVETIKDIENIPLVVLPDVFNPKLLRSGAYLVSQLQHIRSGARVLDLGSGSGVCGIAAARRGCQVVAVDINPSAVRCTRINVLLNRVEHLVDIRHGDLFASVANERFDAILFNPPYYRGSPRDDLDRAWRSPDIPQRFAAELAPHLADGGFALVVLSSDGDPAAFLGAFASAGLTHMVLGQHDFINEIMTVYKVRA